MRRTVLACSLALSAALTIPTGAGATGMSLNYVVLQNDMTVEQCKTFGRNALRRAGLNLLSNSTEAAWGEIRPDIIACIYCLIDFGLAVVSVSGPSTEETAPVLDSIMPYMRK